MLPFIFLLFIFLKLTYSQNYNQPQKFGLLTVTHSRAGNYDIFKKYLKLYATTDCYSNFIQEINIVWNNQITPQQSGVLSQSSTWKIPVYFFHTPFNSMDHRYRLPSQSKSSYFYSLDDDIIVDCQTFNTTFSYFLKQNPYKIGPIIANQVRAYIYTRNEFSYNGQTNNSYYTIAEAGASFVHRHFLQLYYLNINELKLLRQKVVSLNNCDDIVFYAFVQHYYPELAAIYVKPEGSYKNTDPKIGQSKGVNKYPIRHKCINIISQYLGYNPLRIFKKDKNSFLNNYKFINQQRILQLKQLGLASVKMEEAIEKKAAAKQILLDKAESQNIKKLPDTSPNKQDSSQQIQAKNELDPIIIRIGVLCIAIILIGICFILLLVKYCRIKQQRKVNKYQDNQDSALFTQTSVQIK